LVEDKNGGQSIAKGHSSKLNLTCGKFKVALESLANKDFRFMSPLLVNCSQVPELSKSDDCYVLSAYCYHRCSGHVGARNVGCCKSSQGTQSLAIEILRTP